MLDASTAPTTGYVWGNNYWLGSHQSCVLLNQPPKLFLSLVDKRKNYRNLTDTQPLFPVEYRMFYVNHDSKMQLDLYIRNKVIFRSQFNVEYFNNNFEYIFRQSCMSDYASHNHAITMTAQ